MRGHCNYFFDFYITEIQFHVKSYLVARGNVLSALEELQHLFNITCPGCPQEAGVTVRLYKQHVEKTLGNISSVLVKKTESNIQVIKVNAIHFTSIM